MTVTSLTTDMGTISSVSISIPKIHDLTLLLCIKRPIIIVTKDITIPVRRPTWVPTIIVTNAHTTNVQKSSFIVFQSDLSSPNYIKENRRMYTFEEREQIDNDNSSQTSVRYEFNTIHQTEQTEGNNKRSDKGIDWSLWSHIVNEWRSTERTCTGIGREETANYRTAPKSNELFILINTIIVLFMILLHEYYFGRKGFSHTNSDSISHQTNHNSLRDRMVEILHWRKWDRSKSSDYWIILHCFEIPSIMKIEIPWNENTQDD